MSPRALTATAVLAAVLAGPAGRAIGQFPPEAAPLGGGLGGALPAPGGSPFFAGGPLPVVAPILPAQGSAPAVGPPVPVAQPGAVDAGPVLPTDTLGGVAYGPKGWVGVEYLLYWTKDAPLPVPIATAGPGNGSAVIGSPGTQVILGGSNIDFNNFSGVRVLGGYWFTNNESVGVEGNFFILPRKQGGPPTIFGNGTMPVLARPFVNTVSGQQNTRLLTRPGQFTGGITVDADQELWGAEITPVWRVRDNGRWTLDALAGFKYLNLNETLTVSDFANSQTGGGVTIFQGQAFPAPAATYITDRIRTSNNFYGGVLGLRLGAHVDAFSLNFTGKLGLGNMEQTVRADGTTTLVRRNLPPTTSGAGFFVTAANSGKFTQDDFVVIPEFATNLTAQVTSHVAVTFGYTYLCVSDVVRPGDQLGTRIDPRRLPVSTNFGAGVPLVQPSLPMATQNFWANGFNIGLIFGY